MTRGCLESHSHDEQQKEDNQQDDDGQHGDGGTQLSLITQQKHQELIPGNTNPSAQTIEYDIINIGYPDA